MKSMLPIISLLITTSAWSISYREMPLNEMIDQASTICRGSVIKVEKTDSVLIQRLTTRRKNFSLGDPSCGRCTEIAYFQVERCIKGNLQNDTIKVSFHSFFHNNIHGLREGVEYILFIDQIQGFDVYGRSDSRFGAKSWAVDKFEQLITQYLSLETELQKREWIIGLCINPRLSPEGTRNFRFSRPDAFSDGEKQILTKGLLEMNFDEDCYWKLLEIVQGFGQNDKLVSKCFERLETIQEENAFEGLDLMRAINDIEPQPAYQALLNRYFDREIGSPMRASEMMEIVYEFRKHSK